MQPLRSPDPAEGAAVTPDPSGPRAESQSGAPPPAAVVVVEGKTEREVDLEGQLEGERKKIKDRELRIAQLEDENRTLKTIPTPRPAPKKKSEPLTVLDWEDDD